MPPAPPLGWSARFHSLVLALGGAAGRWMGCFGSHLRTLIWILFLRKQGLGEKAFRGGSESFPAGYPTPSVQRTRPVGHTQQVRAAARKQARRAQPTFPPHRLARQGTPRRVPPAAAGGKNFNHIFPGHVPGKRFLSPRECRLRRRGSGCSPQFWEGPPTKQAT